ncbi:ankyrin repeat-containing domain protein, partial [Tuber brumale]
KDFNRRTPLAISVMSGHNAPRIELLLSVLGGEDCQIDSVDRDCETPLHLAAKSGYSSVVEQYLKIRVNAQSSSRRTPLRLAANANREGVSKCLLFQAQRDANAYDFSRRTALHMASNNGNINTVELLEDARTDHNPRELGGETPLHFAARFGQFDLIKVLLTHERINPNVQDNRRRTPLPLSADNCYPRVAQLLLNYFLTSPNIADNMLKTPLHEASEQGLEWVVRILGDERIPNQGM